MRKQVLWGHHVDEYQKMFDLTPENLQSCLLEFGCGTSAFNSELTAESVNVVSCDPLFNLDKNVLQQQESAMFQASVERFTRNQQQYDFSHYGNLQQFIHYRQAGVSEFFADYEQGKQQNRYIAAENHRLPFNDFKFDLALCSHYLFADLDDQNIDLHVNIIQELARVAKEVRIFPLIDRQGQPSPLLGPVLLSLQQHNYGIEVREVSYYLQPKGNAMLRVFAQHCKV